MFPEITRDEVFRIETRRLWLRWPNPADADGMTSIACDKALAEMTAHIPHPYPKGEAAKRIDRWRRKNAAGLGLKLVITGRAADRSVLGLAGLDMTPAGLELGLVLSPAQAGRGFATEAAQAMVDAAFMLSRTSHVEASARVINPAARRVLERCGFVYGGTALQDAPARGGMISSDWFRLDRKTWASLKQWRMPDLTPRVVSPARPATDGHACTGSDPV